MTNPFRRRGAASLLIHGEAWVVRPTGRVEATAKTTLGPTTWLGRDVRTARQRKRRDLRGVCEPGRSREPAYYRCGLRPEGTDRQRTGPHNPVRGKVGGRGCAMNGSRQRNAGSAEEATQGGAAQRDFAWVEASVWTERMLSALGNGVKGGKWFSLMDKVFAPKTLAAAWMKVRANKGAAGVDGKASSGSRRRPKTIWPSCRRRCGREPTARKPSNGSTSPRAMEERGRWAFQRSRIASSSRPSGS